jgi:uncharacterized protein (UPF0371 family)
MSGAIGFDNDLYLREQTAAILERVNRYDKLYLEFGGKLLFDYHAARVLPGYDPNVKMRLLHQLKDQAEVILCIYAGDIERKKMRADFGISYDTDAMKLIDDLNDWEVNVTAVVITRYDNQPSVDQFKNKLERRGIRVYTHRSTRGYPSNVDLIVSDTGYGANTYIETTKPLVVVTAPGPGSGKLATCLTLLYHDHRRGSKAGYSKFETFPIWNLPLKHPVNIAYEAATADLGDVNLIDPFHLEAYGKTTVNYNRDVEVFPVLRKMLERITGGKAVYQSPTDMGVNRAGFGICNDDAVRVAAGQEIIRRFFRYSCEYVMGLTHQDAIQRTELLMEELGLRPEDRSVVLPARQAAQEAAKTGKGNQGIFCGAALELMDGSIITGKNSPLMHAASSLILNATKHLAGLPDSIHLLPPTVTASIGKLKRDILGRKTESLNLDETLIALSISSTSNPAAQAAMEQLKALSGCEMHSTHIPTSGDEAGLKRLGINVTSDPLFPTRNLVEM